MKKQTKDIKPDVKLLENKEKVVNSDIFKESAMRVLKKNEEQVVPMDEDVIYNESITNWAELKKELKGAHAERFNKILRQLPAREFMRVYLKVLEFVQPKVTRQIPDGGDKEDNNLIIHVKRGRSK